MYVFYQCMNRCGTLSWKVDLYTGESLEGSPFSEGEKVPVGSLVTNHEEPVTFCLDVLAMSLLEDFGINFGNREMLRQSSSILTLIKQSMYEPVMYFVITSCISEELIYIIYFPLECGVL